MAKCVCRHRQRWATLTERLTIMQLMQHTLASLLFFADRACSKLVSSSSLNGVQFAREESRLSTLPAVSWRTRNSYFKYLCRTSELTPIRTNYAASWNTTRVFQRLVTIQFFLSLFFLFFFVFKANKLRSSLFIYLFFSGFGVVVTHLSGV